MMSNKRGNIFEQHIDKILLGIVVLIGLFVLLKAFVLSPNVVELGSRKFGPGGIDKEVNKDAVQLEAAIGRPPIREKEYKDSYADKFTKFLDNGIRDIKTGEVVVDGSIYPMIPGGDPDGFVGRREYEKPVISKIDDAKAALFRCVGFVPLVSVSLDNPYGSVADELADVDLVTVGAKFDVASLYESFEDSFAGRGVKDEWRDRDMARPVFAAIELERTVKNEDGSWSEWEKVGATKINDYQELLDVPENVSDVESGVRTLLARLGQEDVQAQLLQPKAYDYAWPDYGWLPPEFYKELKKQIEREEEERRKETLEREREERRREGESRRERGRSDRDRDRRSTTGGGGGGGMMMPGMDGGGGGGMMMPGGGGGIGGMGGGGARRTTTRRERRPDRREGREETRERPDRELPQKEEGPTPEEQFEEIEIDEDTQFDELDELMFWAHDDSVEPGKSYKYRMRLGVANPIAGLESVSWVNGEEGDEDRMIFWSNYSESDEVIDIPERLYLFATDVKSAGSNVFSVMEVAKYNLGNWNKEEFIVRPGEPIGKEVEKKEDDDSRGGRRDDDEKEIVDYTTGAIVLDVINTTKWTGRGILSPRSFYEVIYSDDEGEVERVAAKKEFWSSEVRSLYAKIDEAVKNPVVVGSSRRSTGSKRSSPSRRGGEQTPGGMPGMMPGMPMMPGTPF